MVSPEHPTLDLPIISTILLHNNHKTSVVHNNKNICSSKSGVRLISAGLGWYCLASLIHLHWLRRLSFGNFIRTLLCSAAPRGCLSPYSSGHPCSLLATLLPPPLCSWSLPPWWMGCGHIWCCLDEVMDASLWLLGARTQKCWLEGD